jgi:hypothetical protein
VAKRSLTQAEADALLAMPKKPLSDDHYEFPTPGGSLFVPLVSHDGREYSALDVSRGKIDLAKATYQRRARRVVPLARLDVNGRPHTNPDGEPAPRTHLHLYRESFGLAWAFRVPAARFTHPDDLGAALDDFLRFCNVDPRPVVSRPVST